MPKQLDKETLNVLVDVLLEYKGTSRKRLDEYPNTVWDRDEQLKKAERSAKRLAYILGVEDVSSR